MSFNVYDYVCDYVCDYLILPVSEVVDLDAYKNSSKCKY